MKKLSLTFACTALLLLSIAPLPARAARTPDHLIGTPSLEVARGPAVRVARRVVHDPAWDTPAYRDLVTTAGGSWRVIWDRGTMVPLRIYGSGVAAPGAASPAGAERHARAFLRRYLELLAPGASASDFVLAANDERHGVRTVSFLQHHQGLPVLTGQVSFRYVRERLIVIASEALPFVTATTSRGVVTPAGRAQALAWIQRSFGVPGRISTVHGPYVLPLVAEGGGPGEVSYETVIAVNVETRSPPGRWDVYVDAASGRPVARRQLLRFAAGTVRFNAPQRWPGALRYDNGAAYAAVTLDGTAQVCDAEGAVAWPGSGPTTVVTLAEGQYAQVMNAAGARLSATLLLQDGGAVTWDASTTEFDDAQITSYVYVNRAKAYARGIDPTLAWVDEQIPVTVNEDDVCNAYSDGNALHFFRSSADCNNTGRLADVVYHEFGHSLHANAILMGAGAFDEALSEGVSDYFSATMNDDPAMGQGFFFSNAPLRHIDPAGSEATWPDDISGDTHETGLIIAGALWDLRKALVAELGHDAGVALADQLYYAVLQRASDIPSAYVEVLAADDDDGDLSNGTPHVCAIREAFGQHGLTGGEYLVGGLLVPPPVVDGLSISVTAQDPGGGCAVATVVSATVDWALREEPTRQGTADLTPEGDRYQGDIPDPGAGQVVRYRVTVTLSDGNVVQYPDNPADPDYELFVGEVVALYCTTFETDPMVQGWTHGLSAGAAGEGADDWAWGRPLADPASGDPPMAYSGNQVFGNDLGGGNFNGMYQPDKTNYAQSPVVDATGYTNVRLQYRRWLTVEDGHFDQATVYANDVPVWSNLDSNQGDSSSTQHQDREWRFHDVDLSAAVQDGQVQVKFELSSDGGLEFGGWTIDDLCIVAYVAPYCGDGQLTGDEVCDEGAGNSDTVPDACRSTCQAPACGDGVVDSGEACDDGNAIDDDACTNACTLPPVEPEPKAGCGCATGGPGDAPVAGIGIVLLGLWLGFRRRSSARHRSR